jgi:microcystin-dependent protein
MNYYMPIGTIVLFAGNFAPQGWMYCNGAALSIQQYGALYSILGLSYGGDGLTDFKLPNLIGPVNDGASLPINYIICTDGVFPTRQ